MTIQRPEKLREPPNQKKKENIVWLNSMHSTADYLIDFEAKMVLVAKTTSQLIMPLYVKDYFNKQ